MLAVSKNERSRKTHLSDNFASRTFDDPLFHALHTENVKAIHDQVPVQSRPNSQREKKVTRNCYKENKVATQLLNIRIHSLKAQTLQKLDNKTWQKRTITVLTK